MDSSEEQKKVPPPVSPRKSSLKKDDPEKVAQEQQKKREFAVAILTPADIEAGMKAFREVPRAHSCLPRALFADRVRHRSIRTATALCV